MKKKKNGHGINSDMQVKGITAIILFIIYCFSILTLWKGILSVKK